MEFFVVLVSLFSGLVAGMGGPGGLPIISILYSFEDLTAAQVAGTSSTIFVFASSLASFIYYKSGDVDWNFAKYLAPISVFGTFLGSFVNSYISKPIFGLMISLIIFFVGLNVIYREYNELNAFYSLSIDKKLDKIILLLLGLAVGLIGGIFGVGGPAITVPVLLFLGVSGLEAIGVGLVQALFITSSTSINYFLRGDVNFDLLLIIGVPYVSSQILGWYLAHKINPKMLKVFLGLMLILMAPYILSTI